MLWGTFNVSRRQFLDFSRKLLCPWSASFSSVIVSYQSQQKKSNCLSKKSIALFFVVISVLLLSFLWFIKVTVSFFIAFVFISFLCDSPNNSKDLVERMKKEQGEEEEISFFFTSRHLSLNWIARRDYKRCASTILTSTRIEDCVQSSSDLFSLCSSSSCLKEMNTTEKIEDESRQLPQDKDVFRCSLPKVHHELRERVKPQWCVSLCQQKVRVVKWYSNRVIVIHTQNLIVLKDTLGDFITINQEIGCLLLSNFMVFSFFNFFRFKRES
jgi:hypothetical protein